MTPQLSKLVVGLKDQMWKSQKRNMRFPGTKSISYLGAKVWKIVPDNLKNITSRSSFREQIKKWNPENCSCRLCKTYIQNVAFLN